MTDSLDTLCRRVADALQRRGLILSTAESCTGGGVASALTDLAGSSRWFDSGFVTYSNAAKQAMLGVRPATLKRHGAVSEQTAAEMARGATAHGRSRISCSITGIAGPTGGSDDKPVGTVCFGWCLDDHSDTLTRRLFGDRAAVRRQSIGIALQGILDRIDASEQDDR